MVFQRAVAEVLQGERYCREKIYAERIFRGVLERCFREVLQRRFRDVSEMLRRVQHVEFALALQE